MIIKECYIENFGVLSDAPFSFDDGVNVIKEDNGWGKSTLAVFIKCMFYGMEYTKKRKQLPEYKRYMPWNGGNCGGYLVFCVKDKTYRITRRFGKKESECEFELYDLATNLPSSDYGENLGAELFGIDRSSFERSIFIKLDAEQSRPEMSDSISAKLSNLVDNTDDINNFETAMAALDKLASSIVPKRGANGSAGRTEEEIRRVRDALIDCDNADREISVCRDRIKFADEEIEKLKKREEAASAELKNIDLFEKKKRYERLKANERSLDDRRAELAKFFEKGIPSDEELAARLKEAAELEKHESRAAEITAPEEKRLYIAETEALYGGHIPTDEEADSYAADFDRSVKLADEIDDISEQINDIHIKRRKRMRLRTAKIISFAVIAALWTAFAFVLPLDMTGKIVCALFAAAGFCAAAVFAFMQINESRINETKPLEEQKEALEAERGKCVENLRAVSSDPGNIAAALSAMQRRLGRYKELKRDMTVYDESVAAAEKIKEDLISFLSGYDLSCGTYFDRIQTMRDKLFEYRDALEDHENAASETREFENANDVEALEKVLPTGANRSETEEIRERCVSRVNSLTAERARAEQEIARLTETADERQELENERQKLTERRDELLEKYSILRDTADLLERAQENMTSAYLKDMTDAFEKYVRILEPNRDDIVLTAELNTQIVRGGRQWAGDYHSRGYADMVNVCTRLALADAMYGDEKPPLILDDPFVNLDEKKTERALTFLKRIGEERQIFYFTCHKSRCVEP